MSDKRKENLLFFVGFAVIFLILFQNIIFKGYKLSPTNLNYIADPFDVLGVPTLGPILSDAADQQFPHVFKAFYSGKPLSLWNNSIALGVLSEDAEKILNPFNWVFLLPPGIAFFIRSLIKLVVSFIGMYIYMRSIDIKKFSAAVAGIVYTFSAAMVVWFFWPHTDVCAIAPLLFYAIEGLMRTIKVKYMVMTAIIIYVMMIVGMPTYAAYFLYLAGAYIVIFTFRRHWNNKINIVTIGFMFGIAVLLGGVMSFPYTLKLVMSVGTNGYAEFRHTRTGIGLDLKYLRTFLFPYIREELTAHPNESTLYIGLISLVLLPFAAVNAKGKKRNIFFIVSSVCIFLVIFTNSLTFVLKFLPTINSSGKRRFVAILMFSLSCLAGIGLNDIAVNRETYSRSWISAALLVFWSAVLIFISVFSLRNVELTDQYRSMLRIGIGLILIGAAALLLYIYGRHLDKRVFLFIIISAVIFDNVSFARDYLPLIDRNAKIIPDATDSVEYLQNNTRENHERFVGLGAWLLFPDSASYYDLDDIRAHNFIMTDQKMQNYYNLLDDKAYDTFTRISFDKFDNHELLKYMGVRFEISAPAGNEGPHIGGFDDQREAMGIVGDLSTLRQEFTAAGGTLKGISILLSNYKTEPKSEEKIKVTLSDAENDAVLAEGYTTVKGIEDDSYHTICFDSPADIEEGDYVLDIEFPNMNGETITPWISSDYEGSYSLNGETREGGLVINLLYTDKYFTPVYEAEDGTEIGELDEFASKVFLAENVEGYPDDESVLNAMADKYTDKKAFVVSGNAEEYSAPLAKDEGVELSEYENDYIRINASTDRSRLLVLNDYYYPGWKAYINGEETDILNVNYLMRGVILPAGKDITVEMRFRPSWFYLSSGAFVLAAVAIVLLFVFRGRLQKALEKKGLIIYQG